MKYYRPIKSNYLVQDFGENLACADPKTLRVIPGVYKGTCPLGYEKLYPLIGLKYHNGKDLATWRGEPCYHPAEFNGWMKTEVDSAGGIGVDVVSKIPLKECTEGCQAGTIHYIKVRNWHLLKVYGFDGKEINIGDLIGYCDSTGLSGGDHVHWGPKWCDEKGNGIHKDNGAYGAFDAGLEYENVFILDVLKVKQEALSAIDLARKIIFEVVQFLQKKGRFIGSKLGLGIPLDMSNALNWLVKSSANPEKISLTLKSLAPFILAVAAFFKVDLLDGDLDQLAAALVGIVSGATFIYGLARKISLSYSKSSENNNQDQ